MTRDVTIIRARAVATYLSRDPVCSPLLGPAVARVQHRNGSEEVFPQAVITVVEAMLERQLDPATASKADILGVAANVLDGGGRVTSTAAATIATTAPSVAPAPAPHSEPVVSTPETEPAFNRQHPEFNYQYAAWSLLLTARELLTSDCTTGAGSRMRRLDQLVRELGPTA